MCVDSTRYIPGIGNADHPVAQAKRHSEQNVGDDCTGVGEAEQRVIGEHGLNAQYPGVDDGLECERRERRVAVHDVDAFADQDVPQDRKRGEQRWQCALVVDHIEWQVVDFHSVRHVPHAGSIAVGVRHDHHLVAAVHQALRQLINVAFDTPNVRVEEIAHHAARGEAVK